MKPQTQQIAVVADAATLRRVRLALAELEGVAFTPSDDPRAEALAGTGLVVDWGDPTANARSLAGIWRDRPELTAETLRRLAYGRR